MLNCNLISLQKGANLFVLLVINSFVEALSPVEPHLCPAQLSNQLSSLAQMRVRCLLAHSESKIEFGKSMH